MTMQKREPTVAEFMTEVPATADQGLLLSDARERMHIDHIRHLVVLKGGHLSGVLSSRDISLALSFRGVDATAITVGEAMSGNVYACIATTPISQVAAEMEAHGHGCAIVTNGGDEVLGVFTTTDALRALREVVTGKHVEALAPADHLPPTEADEVRPFRLRQHRPIDTGSTKLFSTT